MDENLIQHGGGWLDHHHRGLHISYLKCDDEEYGEVDVGFRCYRGGPKRTTRREKPVEPECTGPIAIVTFRV